MCEKNLEWIWLAKFIPWTRQKKKTQDYKVSNVDLLDLLKILINDMNLKN